MKFIFVHMFSPPNAGYMFLTIPYSAAGKNNPPELAELRRPTILGDG